MATQLNAKIENIEPADKFKVGANPSPPNQFKLLITNLGAAISTDDTPHFYLKGRLGLREDALFLDETELRGCVMFPPRGWQVVWRKTDDGFQFDIFTFDTDAPILKKDDVLAITFSKVVSKTAPGEARLTFVVAIPGLKQDAQDLSILKVADKPDIISFTSDPPEGVQNLPGEDVILNWRVYKLNNLELTQVGIADPLPCDFSKEEGSKTITSIPADTEFRLRGYAGSRPIDRTLGVKVLRNDWYDLKKSILEGDPGYPAPRNEDEAQALATGPKRFELEPTLLFNANDQSLYGVFRHEFNGSERALLFQTKNP